MKIRATGEAPIAGYVSGAAVRRPAQASSLLRRCRSLPGRKVRGGGKLDLRFNARDPIAQRRDGAFQRLRAEHDAQWRRFHIDALDDARRLMRSAGRPPAAKVTAREVVARPALTVGLRTPIADAARLMVEKRFKILCVVDEDGRLMGIVDRADLLRAAGDALRDLAAKSRGANIDEE